MEDTHPYLLLLYYDGIRATDRLYLVSEILVCDEYIEPEDLIDEMEYDECAASIDCVYLGDSIYGYLSGNVIIQIYESFLKSEGLRPFTKMSDDENRYVLYTDITDVNDRWDFMLTKFISMTPNEFNQIYPDSTKFVLDDLDFLDYEKKALEIPLNSNPFKRMRTRKQQVSYMVDANGTLQQVLMTSDVIRMLSVFSFYVASGSKKWLMCITK